MKAQRKTIPSTKCVTQKKSLRKSTKTRERIEELQDNLKSYRKSIENLHAFAEGRKTLKGKHYTDGAKNYRRTEIDNKRLAWTLNNLLWQIALSQRELDTLQKYGE